LDCGEADDEGLAGFSVFVGHDAVDVGAGLIRQEIAERVEDDRVAIVLGDVGLDGLQDVGMGADEDGCAGFHEFMGEVGVFGARGGGVFDAPVDGEDEEVALGAGGFDGCDDSGFFETGRARGFAWVGEEVDVGLVFFLRILVAVEPAGHAQDADFDSRFSGG
jgi:hypothetical protein